jgi:hypothetical protein
LTLAETNRVVLILLSDAMRVWVLMMTDDDAAENKEKVVACPVEGCDSEHPSRGLHLHLMRSASDGHGEVGEYPDVDVDDLTEVGRQEVDVDYPEERESESVVRLCPYCKNHFSGKEGVAIHLGLVEGRKNHPRNASDFHSPEDFPVVKLDEKENIISVVERGEDTVDEEDKEAFATFTKSEVDCLSEAIREAGLENEQAGLILRRAYLEHIG